MKKQNKYPKAKKCPVCGQKMSDGDTCYSRQCFGMPKNREKKPFIPKYQSSD